jgi:hypothetical protein
MTDMTMAVDTSAGGDEVFRQLVLADHRADQQAGLVAGVGGGRGRSSGLPHRGYRCSRACMTVVEWW